eukprot:CAMPEP_0177706884 /NCGR_PEP_ID=MMETSP0484_2-20121128/9460_1 /TAXON_ID=354590 /ORGANISM="Rhodomonas lens, Strain RHODO" /LENGTH=233 /DNA_ID=CAMNT_0019218369 /DNA_START=9 /DNA_END=707 /DNA_ORIENTATION=-
MSIIRLKPKLELALVNSVRVVLSPFYDAPSSNEFAKRITSAAVRATNPKCEINIDRVPESVEAYKNPPPPKIEIEYADGTKDHLVPDRSLPAHQIVKHVQDRCSSILISQQIAEMKKSPVVGPAPVKIWRGRRQTFCDYAEDEAAKKKAAGGVKTIKKKERADADGDEDDEDEGGGGGGRGCRKSGSRVVEEARGAHVRGCGLRGVSRGVSRGVRSAGCAARCSAGRGPLKAL